MRVFFTLGHADGFAPMRRDQVKLADIIFRASIGVTVLPRFGFAIGEECNPFAVRRPSGLRIVARLSQLNQTFRSVHIKPEIATEDLLIPVGSLRGNDDRIAIGRDLDAAETHGIKELVNGELWFLREDREHTADCDNHYSSSFSDHRFPGGKKVYTTADSLLASSRALEIPMDEMRNNKHNNALNAKTES